MIPKRKTMMKLITEAIEPVEFLTEEKNGKKYNVKNESKYLDRI